MVALLYATMSSLSTSLPSMFLLNKHKPNPELYQAKILEYANKCQQQQALPT